MDSARRTASGLGESAPVAAPVAARNGGRMLCGLIAVALAAGAALYARAPSGAALMAGSGSSSAAAEDLPPLPARLSATGLYVPGSPSQIDPRNLSYVPQYPLWSDGASKRRWIRVPEGYSIDASDPDRFRFPLGTRFWKEFSFEGVRTETRYMELTAAGFRYATYVWNAAGTDAELAPETGLRGVRALAGGARHDIPSQLDCTACHAGKPGEVLGFSALQLSPDRDPLAVHAERETPGDVDLPELARRGLVSALPAAVLETPPRISARTPTERAALGYLYANCSHCHNNRGPLAALDLDFDVSSSDGASRAKPSSVERPSQYRLPHAERSLRIAPGHPRESSVFFRMASAAPAARMPPLGARRLDTHALALVERWISEDL